MPLRIGLVVPHIFMQDTILPQVIFSPGTLALELANGLSKLSVDVTLFTPGNVATIANNITADLSYFENELSARGDSYLDLLKKHPLTFVTLARQVQSELVAKAYSMANNGQIDIVHIYTNEEELAMPFASLCKRPVVFTHHDPFSFLVRYKNMMPKYSHLNWVSISHAQRADMPADTNWVGNVYHGHSDTTLKPVQTPTADYFAYFGRIIEPKGVHLAIKAVNEYNKTSSSPMKLKIAGKHYSESEKNSYWEKIINPKLGNEIEYVGFINTSSEKRNFLGNAAALIVPSLFAEPFGMVTVEAFACGTPVVALNSGALNEVIDDGLTGFVVNTINGVDGKIDETATTHVLAEWLAQSLLIDRKECRKSYETYFTAQTMCQGYYEIYQRLIKTFDKQL